MQRVWSVRRGGREAPKTLEALKRLLLTQRGIDETAAPLFFTPLYDKSVHDPQLLSDMDKAVDRMYQAIDKKQRIIVHGDYDADGISGTAILLDVLTRLGALVAPHLPNRTDDGYGLNQEVLKELAHEMDLLVTVDCGISSVEEIAMLKKRRIDTIVIDHHSLPKELPKAVAIVHPRHPKGEYPFPWLCGAGVAWKVAQALLRDARSPYHDDPDQEKWLLDLAVLGTIADVVPLIDENRAIVRFGLEVLKRTRRPGLAALLASARTAPGQLSTEDVAFRLIPRINAAGRLGDALPALELLVTKSEQRAQELLTELNARNQLRQTLTRQVLAEAEMHFNPALPFVFAANAAWPAGIVGLAAGRLSEKFQRPAVVVGGAGERLVGSARSPQGSNVLALLEQGRAHLDRLGGHAQAAGFTVAANGLDNFRQTLEAATLPAAAQEYEVVTDAVIASDIIHQSTVDVLKNFAPFGEGNQQPLFVVRNLGLLSMRPVGKEQKHAKFTFRLGEEVMEGIGFGLHEQLRDTLLANSAVDVVCQLDENEYRGRRRLEVKVKDAAPANSIVIRDYEQSDTVH